MSFLSTAFGRKRPVTPGPWLGVSEGPNATLAALAATPRDHRPAVQLMAPMPAPASASALRVLASACARRTRANWVMGGSEYQVLPVQLAPLPPGEWRDAARWQLADQLDMPPEEAALDLMPLPTPLGQLPAAAAGAVERHAHLAVVCPREALLGWLTRCREAELPLAAVDIAELALRNLSVLAAGMAPHALLHLGLHSTRLVVVWQGALCLYRRFDLQLADWSEPAAGSQALIERLALDLQRTLDSFSRQFAGTTVQGLWVHGPATAHDAIAALRGLLAVTVHAYALDDHVDVRGTTGWLDAANGLDHTLAIGAALRHEAQDVDADAASTAPPGAAAASGSSAGASTVTQTPPARLPVQEGVA